MARATTEVVSDAVLATDASGRVTQFNQRYAAMWGASPTTAITGADYFDLVERDARLMADPQRFLQRTRDIHASGAPEHVDLLELADGRLIERICRNPLIEGRWAAYGLFAISPNAGGSNIRCASSSGNCPSPTTLESEFPRSTFPNCSICFRRSLRRWSAQKAGWIGLVLVRAMVDLHGGTVEVRSPGLGKGSDFMVRLPLAPSHEPREDEPSLKPRAAQPPKRILVVDDNVDGSNCVFLRSPSSATSFHSRRGKYRKVISE